jgi:hypothetical protein
VCDVEVLPALHTQLLQAELADCFERVHLPLRVCLATCPFGPTKLAEFLLVLELLEHLVEVALDGPLSCFGAPFRPFSVVLLETHRRGAALKRHAALVRLSGEGEPPLVFLDR